MSKLSDDKFAGQNKSIDKPKKIDKEALRAALNPNVAAEQLFDKIAQGLMAPTMGQTQPQPKKRMLPVHAGMWEPRAIRKHYRKLRSMGYGVDDADMAVSDALSQGAGGDGVEDNRVKDYFKRLWYSTISTKPHEEALYRLGQLEAQLHSSFPLDEDELMQARDWLSDCSFSDAGPEDLERLSDIEVEKAVARLYSGGLRQFKIDCMPMPAQDAVAPKLGQLDDGGDLSYFVVLTYADGMAVDDPDVAGAAMQYAGGKLVDVVQSDIGGYNAVLPPALAQQLEAEGHLKANITSEIILSAEMDVDAVEDDMDSEASLSGDTLSTEEMEGTGKIGQMQKSYEVSVQWTSPPDPQQAKMMRDRMMRTVSSMPSIKIDDESANQLSATAWNTDEHELSKLSRDIQQNGGMLQVKRVAQMDAPGMPAGDTTTLPPAGGPPAEASPAPADMLGDDMSLEEALEQLEEASQVVVDKVKGGETVDSQGNELIPDPPMDTGAIPAPPEKVAEPKTAVDQDAKSYWHELFGDYGDQLAEDRVASVVDIVEEVFGQFGVELSGDQFSNVASLLLTDGRLVDGTLASNIFGLAHVDSKVAAIVDRTLATYVANHSLCDSSFSHNPFTMQAMLVSALKESNSTDGFVKLVAQKLKVPSVKGQPDDAVDIEHDKDEAEKSEQTKQMAHIPMWCDEQEFRGKYLHMTIKWETDAQAADRGDEALMHAVTSFVKGMEGDKEFKDLGFLGQISFSEFDSDAGLAEVYVRTDKGSDAVNVIKTE